MFVFPGPRPFACLSCPGPQASAPSSYLPALVPSLYLPALAPSLYLPSLAYHFITSLGPECTFTLLLVVVAAVLVIVVVVISLE